MAEACKDRPEIDDPLTYEIIGAAQKVHRTLGPGFGESVYHKALGKELTVREIPFESEPQFEVFYENYLCGIYKPDFVVDKKVVVEIKALAEVAPRDRMQTISYLKASGLRTGLLLNFGAASLEFRRLKNDPEKTSI